MSTGMDYTNQWYDNNDSWTAKAKIISEKWNEGFYITQATYAGTAWLVVMSETSCYIDQGYMWASTLQAVKSQVLKKWDEGYSITTMEYGNGEYFIVYSKYSGENSMRQSYKIEFFNTNKYVQSLTDKNMQIAYIGGDYEKDSGSGTSSSSITRTEDKDTPDPLDHIRESLNLISQGLNVLTGGNNGRETTYRNGTSYHIGTGGGQLNSNVIDRSSRGKTNLPEHECSMCNGKGKIFSLNQTMRTNHNMHHMEQGWTLTVKNCDICGGSHCARCNTPSCHKKCPKCQGKGTTRR